MPSAYEQREGKEGMRLIMKILSIDTSSNICGVSILEDTNLINSIDINTDRTHSENLMPIIKDILKKSNLSLNNIDLIVCDKGPRFIYWH